MCDITKVCKFPCDTCKLCYSSQSELQEHLWSLMHHVRLEQKEKPTEHVCCLCQTSTSNLVQYGQHLNEIRHKQALTKLREKKLSENNKPPLMSLKRTAPPSLLPNKSWHLNYPFSHVMPYKSWHLNYPFSHVMPYISPLNNCGPFPQPHQSFPPRGDQLRYSKVNHTCSEERVGSNCNDGGGDKDVIMVDQQLFKSAPGKQNKVLSSKKVTVKKKKTKLDTESNTLADEQNSRPESGSCSQKKLVKDSNQNLSDSGSASKSKRKMLVTTPSGFLQGLFLEEDFKKNKLDLVKLNLINATNDKGDKLFANKLLAGLMKDNNNISQHSSLQHLQTKNLKPTKLTTKSRSLNTTPNLPKKQLTSLSESSTADVQPNLKPTKSRSLKTTPNLPKKQLTFPPESSTAAVQPLNNPSKTQPETFLKAIPSKVTKPLEIVKDSQNKPNTIDKNLTVSSSQKEINSNDKTVKVQSENILPSPNTSNNAEETTKNSKNSPVSNSLSQSPGNSDLKIKESDPKTTKLLEAKSNSTSSVDLATYKPTSSQSETAISGLARKRTHYSEYTAGSSKPNLMKKLKCSTSKEINVSDKNQNLSLDAACGSGKKVDSASNSSTAVSNNLGGELTPAKPDSTVEKQQLGKNVGKEELVKMTKLSCLNHKEKMHLSSVMKLYTKTQNKRSAVPRLSMQLTGIYNTNSEKLNLPEGLEDQITMLIKKENLVELENTVSSSDQFIPETGQPTTVSDTLNPLSTLAEPGFTSVKNSLVSAGKKAKTKTPTKRSKANAKSVFKEALRSPPPPPPPSGNSVCIPTTTTNTTISTTTTTANNSEPLHVVQSPQNVPMADTVEPNSQTHDVFSKVYLLTLQEEEVCGNLGNLNNRISYLEKLIEDSQIALQSCRDEQLNLVKKEKNIRKMRIDILKEAMGDTNRSNSELINQLLRSHLSSEGTLRNTSTPSSFSLSSNEQPSYTQQDGTVDQKIPLEVLQTQLTQFRPDSSSRSTAAAAAAAPQETIRPAAAVLENTGVQTITEENQPTLATLLAKWNQPEPNFMTQGRQLQQSSCVTQEQHHQVDAVARSLLVPKDVAKNLKIPKALIASVFEDLEPQTSMFSNKQIWTDTQPTNAPGRISSGKKEPKRSVFQFSPMTPLMSTKEASNNISSDSCGVLPTEILDPSKEMPETNQFSNKKGDHGSCESEVKNVSTEPTTTPLGCSFNNVQIKMEPISPEATGTKLPVSSSVFNFPIIKEEPKSPTELGESSLDESCTDLSSAISHTDNPHKVDSIKQGQLQVFLQTNAGNPASSESRCVNPSNSNIGSDGVSSEQSLQTGGSERSSNLSISLPVDGSGQFFIKDEPLSPVPKTSTTFSIQQNSPPSLQSTTASNDPVEPSSLPDNDTDDREKPNEELEFFSSLSVKHLWDSSHIESLPEDVDPEECSSKVSMKYLGSMSNNLVEQLKECWKKQNVTMNKCFPQGQSDEAAANIPDGSFTSTCETSTKNENHSTLPPHTATPYTMNVEKSNKFILSANLNPIVSIEPLNLSTKYNSSASKSTYNSRIPSNKVIVIDGSSCSEDDDTVNKLPTSTTLQQIYINSDSDGYTSDILHNKFSTESPEKDSDSDSMANTNNVYKGPNYPVTNCFIFGNYLYASYQGHSPQKFDLKTRICVTQYNCEPFSVQCMLVTGFSIAKPVLFSGGASEMLLAFNEITGLLLTKIDLMKKIYTFHEKWNSLFVGLADGGVSKINLKTLKETSNISYGNKPIHCLATCTQGALRILCLGAYDASILIVDASSGLLLKTLLPCQRLLYSIKVFQNLIYSCSEDKKLAVFDIESGKLLKCIQPHSGTVSCLYVDNKILVTGSHDKLINVYWGSVTDLGKIQPLSFYGAGKQSVSCLTVSDKKIFSGNFYGTIEALNIPSENTTEKWLCSYNKCTIVFGLQADLRHHVQSEHLKGQIAKQKQWGCQWTSCSKKFNSLSLLTSHCDRHLNQ